MIFELENVELSFNGKAILYGVYIKAETGKITGILGRNGCGKSSLLKVFFGNLKANNKLVRINKKPVLRKFYTTGMVKFLPQNNFFSKRMRISTLFSFYKVSWTNFHELFPEFKKYQKTRYGDLSNGEQRLLSIWLSIKSPSEIILLDEPFTQLSPIYIAKIKKELIFEKQQKAIVVTDHLYREIFEISDHLYFLQDGCTQIIENKKELVHFGYIN